MHMLFLTLLVGKHLSEKVITSHVYALHTFIYYTTPVDI